MISPQLPKTFNKRGQATNSVKKIRYMQSPKNQISTTSNISRIATSPKSQPGNVLQERFNSLQNDAFYSIKNTAKNKNSIPSIKSTKKKEEKKILLEISSLNEIHDSTKSDEDYFNELENFTDALNETKKLLEDKEKKLKEMQEQINQSKTEKEMLQEEVDELKYLFQLIQDPNEEAKKEIQKYKGEIDEKNQDLEMQKDQNFQLKNQVSSCLSKIKEFEEKEKKSKELIDSIQKENLSLINSLKEKEDLIRTFNNEDKLDLILQNDNLIEKVKNYEKSDKEKSEQISYLQDTISEAQQQIQKYNDEKVKSEKEIQNLLTENSELKTKNDHMMNEIDTKAKLISGLESNNIKFQKTIIEQENSIKELNVTIEESRKLLGNFGKNRKTLVQIYENGKIAELEDLLQEKRNCLQDLNEQMEQMKKEFDIKDKELAKAQKDLMDQTSITVSFASRLSKNESELNECKQKNSELTYQIKELKLITEKNDKIKSLLGEKIKENHQMQQTITNLTDENEQSKSLISTFSIDIQKLKGEIVNLKNMNQTLSTQNKEFEENLSVTKENLKKFESQNASLESKLTRTNRVIEEMNKKVNTNENYIKEHNKIEADMRQSMQILLNEKQILTQKYEENERALNSICKNFSKIKSEYDDLIKKYQLSEETCQNYEEVKLKFDKLLKEFKVNEDKILTLSQTKDSLEQKVYQLNEENKNLLYKIDSLQNEYIYENTSMISNDNFSMINSMISTPKSPNMISSLKLKIKSQNKKIIEMQNIINELTQLIHVFEEQISNSNVNLSSDCDKEQLINENNRLQVEVESLKAEKDQLKNELINVKTMAKKLTLMFGKQ